MRFERPETFRDAAGVPRAGEPPDLDRIGQLHGLEKQGARIGAHVLPDLEAIETGKQGIGDVVVIRSPRLAVQGKLIARYEPAAATPSSLVKNQDYARSAA
ncbi:LbetaH domain-containing protein [Sphingomicrobium lutaoense]|uniref:Uncharacterized protein n=1 Tax=Sphingomicrobium lutaoense TaxID=515949 RepID=A0A839Z547_9SPHN|nr:hypothetical protein [Sphingomicrobium lutaoense]MBB3765003.1 hypothetical protein [Sphingomicrobium lutaoense]